MTKLPLLLLFALIGTDAIACGCDRPKTISDVEWKKPDFIFEGSIEDVVTGYHAWGKSQHVTFKIAKLHRGEKIDRITVDFRHGSSSCDLEPLDFVAGQSYLISASGYLNLDKVDPKNEPVARRNYSNYCDLRQRLHAVDSSKSFQASGK